MTQGDEAREPPDPWRSLPPAVQHEMGMAVARALAAVLDELAARPAPRETSDEADHQGATVQ